MQRRATFRTDDDGVGTDAGGLWLDEQPVAATRQGLDVSWVIVMITQDPAHFGNGVVQSLGAAVAFPPDCLEQEFTTDDITGTFGQAEQDLGCLGCQVQGFTVAREPSVRRLDEHVVQVEAVQQFRTHNVLQNRSGILSLG